MQPTVFIVNTGTANLASVRAAFRRLEHETRVVEDRDAIRDAELLVLPGVGSFESGMARLERMGISGDLRERVDAGRPLMAVCLGLQLLCSGSEESPGVSGLDIIDAEVARFRTAPIVPQLGWNRVEGEGCELVTNGYAYYANSFRLGDAPAGWRCAFTTHGERFVAALEKDGVLACQFHPELSGRWGHALMRRWLARGGASC
jgi:imidazole glycerol phosphate synthase glutamine amidotransferase subunit